MRSYLYNPRAALREEKSAAQRKPPDVLARLRHRRKLTREMSRLNYISKAIGQLSKDGFVFAYGLNDGYLAWPPEYLEAVLTHYYAEMSINEQWDYEAYEATLASSRLSETENAQLSASANELTSRLAARYNQMKANS